MNLNKVNKLAKRSLSAFTANPIIRRYNRRRVYQISENYANFDIEEKRANSMLGVTDTEPWPFSCPDFCPWPEDDSEDHYTLFPNPAGFVTGHSTAYVSAKIMQKTGKWPTIREAKDCENPKHAELAAVFHFETPHRFDAANWGEFLALNGFTEHEDRPTTGHRYVGIKYDYGEFGLVVWYERRGDEPYTSIVSTRIDRKFCAMKVNDSDYDWVRID